MRYLPQDELIRINAVIALIPNGVQSILDAGCGNGIITNRLPKIYPEVVGVDNNPDVLKHVRTPNYLYPLDATPFHDKVFDCTLCCEVLEHIKVTEYHKVLRELERVTSKYIIISVPNEENLRQAHVHCAICGCEFHPSGHVRAFDRERLEFLFPNFDLVGITDCYTTEQPHPAIKEAYRIYKTLTGSHPPQPSGITCPQCFYTPHYSGSGEPPAVRTLAQKIGDYLPKQKQAQWLLALYERRQDR